MNFGEQDETSRISAPNTNVAGPLEAAADLAIRKLDQLSRLDDADRAKLRQLIGPVSDHRTGADLGDDSDASCRILVAGWAARMAETPWGGRQILDFLIPGDTIGLSIGQRVSGLYRVVGLSRTQTLDARLLRDLLRRDPDALAALNQACQKDERLTASRLVSHTVRLGAPTASHAMAHLFLELRERLDQVGLLAGLRFPMPLSQEALHDALGVTITQVYRVLRQMRQDGLIRLGPGWAEIPDPVALADFAGLGAWRR